MTVWQTADDLEDVLRFNEQFSILCFSAQDLRYRGLEIAHYPLDGNLNNCEVYGQITGSK